MRRELDRMTRDMAADIDNSDAGWLMVAVVNQIVALETRIAQAAERAALLAELEQRT